MELSSSEDEHDIVNELRLQIAEMHYELEQQQDYIEQLESETLQRMRLDGLIRRKHLQHHGTLC